jgi:hypothetical protein
MIASYDQDYHKKNNILESKESGRMPDFMIIGAMKSGTTNLFSFLGKHPAIFVPRWKEPQYFSRDHKFNLGEKFYCDHFVDARKDQIIGEGSTCYSRWPQYPNTAERIAKRLPNIRLIYLMRHPVERAYSHYGHIMQKRIIKKDGPIVSFETALSEEKEIIDASLYKMQIERYLSFFPKDQMLFLTFDEFKSSPETLLYRTQKFLGVDPINLSANGEGKPNQWGDNIANASLKKTLQNIRNIPAISSMINLLPKDTRNILYDSVVQSKAIKSVFKYNAIKKKTMLSPLTQKTRKELALRFKESTNWLEEFLDIDLSQWDI